MSSPKICKYCGEYEHDCKCLAAKRIAKREQEIASLKSALKECAEANKRGADICRAFRYSMDRAVPFPSLEQLNGAIQLQEEAISLVKQVLEK